MEYTEHTHDEDEIYDVGAVTIEVSYVITFWNNIDKKYKEFKGQMPIIYDEKEAIEVYDNMLPLYDNVVLEERQEHNIVMKSTIKTR
jgi:hypothetical protein